MKLIDVEPIVKFIKDGLNNPNKEEAFGYTAVQILTEIEYAPTVDAVEVVRCEDCKWAKSYDRGDGLTGYYCQHPNSTFLYGTNWERIFEPVRESNDFCSYGVKREES